jgi:cell division protein FtsW
MLWAVLGFAAMVFMMNYDYHKLERWANVLLVLSILLLLAVFIPGVGATINEATRWIKLGPITIQPAEIAKIAMIIYMARSMSKKNDAMKTFSKGVIPYLIIAGIFFIIIVMQPNLSTALTMVMLCFVMMFAAGARIGHLTSLLGIGAGAAVYIISSGVIADTYWYKRIMIFRDPFQDTSDTGFQLVQSLYALGSGGLWGVGLGNSRQKQFYLPMPQNDFIFAIICEELGFIGGVAILFIFMFLIWRGLRVAITAKDSFGRLLATGIISIVALQVIMNVAVVTSSMPPTGVPMPFISAGGSSLSISMASMGILLNISKHCEIE